MAFTQVITDVGLAKIAAALAGGPKVVITEMAVGDADITPISTMTALGNEVWRGGINAIEAISDPDTVCIEALVPVDGAVGETLREAGAFDADGDMILIARIPDTYKPDPAADLASIAAYIRLNLAIANASSALELTTDNTAVLATRDYADRGDVGSWIHQWECFR